MALRSFHRTRRFFRVSPSLAAAIHLCGFVAALGVVAELILLAMVAELLVHQGTVTLPKSVAAEARTWAGPPSRSDGSTVTYDQRGMVSLAWRWRESAVGPLLQAAYHRFPGKVLQSNLSHLTALCTGLLIMAAVQAAGVALLHAARVHGVEDVARQVRTAILRQAYELGGTERLDGRATQPSELFDARSEQLRDGFAAWWSDLSGPAVLLAMLLLITLLIHPWLAVVAVLVALPLGWLIYRRQARAHDRQRRYADRAATIMDLLKESLAQVRLVRGYLLRTAPGDAPEELLERHRRAVLTQHAPFLGSRAWTRLVVFSAAVALLFLTAINVLRSPPDVTVVQAGLLAMTLFTAQQPLRRLLSVPPRLRRAEAAARAIFVYLDREPRIGQLPEAVVLPRMSRSVELREVTVHDAGGRKRLDSVSLTVPAKSCLAVVTTDHELTGVLAAALTRFLDPDSGRVLLDDHDLRHATLDSVRGQIAVVLSERLLFTGTVTENIRCGDPRFGDVEVTEAAKRTNAYGFVQQLPQGFATIVGEHGMRLDPGEAFRVALARAVLRDPALLILEEPPVPPTEETAQLVYEAVQRSTLGRTTLVVPACLQTLRMADQVVLIHESRLVDQGTHGDLLHSNNLYRHLNYVRFSDLRSVH